MTYSVTLTEAELQPGTEGYRSWAVLATLAETDWGREMLLEAAAGKYVMLPDGTVRYRP